MPGARSTVGLGGMLGRLGVCFAIGSAIVAVGGRAQSGDSVPAKSDPVALGYEIFNREWLPDDPRSHGGDGLGPVYNDTSCVACHNSGGSGGAGPASKNIDILSVSREAAGVIATGGIPRKGSSTLLGRRSMIPSQSVVMSTASRSSSPDRLTELHAGFRTSRTAVLHKFGTDPNYDAWRSREFRPTGGPDINPLPLPPREESTAAIGDAAAARPGNPKPAAQRARGAEPSATALTDARIQEIRMAVLTKNPELRRASLSVGPFAVARSQRNPTPLFGLGLIDAIPDRAIEQLEIEEARTSPETKGRVSRLKDGRIGRLGWKGQTANTEDFVLNACAVELGLEVPGHAQAIVPQAPKYRSPGLDLDADECAALVAYVRSLPTPMERRPSNDAEAGHIKAGKARFAGIGCTNCHAQKVGAVDGIYSDLLLHDMGDDLGDEGSYSPGDPDDPDDPPFPDGGGGAVASRRSATTTLVLRVRKGAGKQEWRTPPLWGFRDSGPYLHDGRAETLEQAVAMHGGQGAASAQKFFELSPRERLQVEAFLKSLVAPPAAQLAHRGE